MKLSWRDLINTMLAIAGGAVVYAMYYDFSWAGLGSWRSASAVLAIIGVLMYAFSNFNFSNRSIMNVGEMMLGTVAVVLAILGVILTSEFVFYSLAAVLGVLWLMDTSRHVRHSMRGDETPGYHHHASAH